MALETAVEPQDVVNVVTGELIPRTDIEAVADAWRQMQEARTVLSDAMKRASDVLSEEAARQGVRKLHGVEVVEKKEYVWDMPTLRTLLQAGLPEERWSDFVTTVENVNMTKLATIGRINPEYQSIIDGAQAEVKVSRYLKRGKS